MGSHQGPDQVIIQDINCIHIRVIIQDMNCIHIRVIIQDINCIHIRVIIQDINCIHIRVIIRSRTGPQPSSLVFYVRACNAAATFRACKASRHSAPMACRVISHPAYS